MSLRVFSVGFLTIEPSLTTTFSFVIADFSVTERCMVKSLSVLSIIETENSFLTPEIVSSLTMTRSVGSLSTLADCSPSTSSFGVACSVLAGVLYPCPSCTGFFRTIFFFWVDTRGSESVFCLSIESLIFEALAFEEVCGSCEPSFSTNESYDARL